MDNFYNDNDFYIRYLTEENNGKLGTFEGHPVYSEIYVKDLKYLKDILERENNNLKIRISHLEETNDSLNKRIDKLEKIILDFYQRNKDYNKELKDIIKEYKIDL